eukprot:COSAG01_NODE_5847_length_3998_cov_19.111824_2_plen_50_part_00
MGLTGMTFRGVLARWTEETRAPVQSADGLRTGPELCGREMGTRRHGLSL